MAAAAAAPLTVPEVLRQVVDGPTSVRLAVSLERTFKDRSWEQRHGVIPEVMTTVKHLPLAGAQKRDLVVAILRVFVMLVTSEAEQRAERLRWLDVDLPALIEAFYGLGAFGAAVSGCCACK